MRANEEDFDGFYAAVFARLVGQLALVTGDLHEAEDVVQEALARAVPRWVQLRAYDVPEAWVRHVALNLAVSHQRQARRRLAALLRLGPPPAVPPVSADALALAEALRGLSMLHRQVLVLHHLLGLPVEEVARQLAIPVGTVKARLARGRRSRARRRAAAVAVAGILVAGVAAVGLLCRRGSRPPHRSSRPSRPPGSRRRTCPMGSGSTPPGVCQGTARATHPRSPIIPRPHRGPRGTRRGGADGQRQPAAARARRHREARSYPTVRVVEVRGRAGLLFPARPGNFTSGLT
jgi:RNA polymerase sigma-70 factor, ECF subfamily